MKIFKSISAILILILALCSLGSCSSDKDHRSKAVLASANSLNFEGAGGAEQIISVFADAGWVAEYPEWISVSPESGYGMEDVVVAVTDNVRDGELDKPRRASIVFKGATIASQSKVLVLQSGDKYRDVQDFTLADIKDLEDETAVSIATATVMTLTAKGFVVSDGEKNNIYIETEEKVNVGDDISFLAIKNTDSQSLPMLEIEKDMLEIVTTGGTVTYPTPNDITAELDSYKSDWREFIQIQGILTGNSIAVDNSNFSVTVVDAPESLNIKDLNGHFVTVKGYFAGLAAPVVRIMASELQDGGLAKVTLFSEDFEWLDPWSAAGNAGQTVETDNMSAGAPQIVTPKVGDVSALSALEAKGYEFLRVTTKTPGECIYLQRNYLKFGKTSYQAGIVLPSIDNVPAGASTTLAFDWSVMRQGSGTIDPVNLIVIVANGAEEVTFDIPESGFVSGQKIEWIKAEVQLSGVVIDQNTRITIRQTQWPAATANRWFLDNIELYMAK